MAGWKVAAITTAIVGAAGVGAAIGPTARGQSLEWLDEPVQKAFTLISGSGSRIGVSVRDVEEADLKGQKAVGAVITEGETDSPAEKAGFTVGDIVIEFDGERVRSTLQFSRLVHETPVGRQVQASVMRDGQRVALTVTPREGSGYSYFNDWNTTFASKLAPTPRVVVPKIDRYLELGTGWGRLGISVQGLSSQLAEYFGTKEGVLVTSVNEASAAAKAGLKAGDVITSLNASAVTSSADFQRQVQRLAAGDEFTLGIVRDKKPTTLKGKIEGPAARRRVARTII
jgi:serine protease Do